MEIVKGEIIMSTKYTYKDYVESQKVKDAKYALDTHSANKPGAYVSQWQGKQDDLLSQYQNRGPFTYDLASDALYKQYADRYSQLGKMAMQDTTGQAAALTGGYGNSYAVTAGNQAYQNYLQGVNDIVPELAQMAYDKYKQEGQDMLNLYGLYGDRENTDYARWQDNMSYWENERQYLADMYNNERVYDRNNYDSDRNFDYGQWNDNRNYDYQVERDKKQDEQWAKEFGEQQRQFNLNYNLQKQKSSGSNNSKDNPNPDVKKQTFLTIEDAAKYMSDRGIDNKKVKDVDLYDAREWKRQKELGNSKPEFKYDSYQDYLSAYVYYVECNQ